MKSKELTYLAWHDDPCWVANIILGSKNAYYQFLASWNNRSDSWHITIKQDDEVIIQGSKLVLEVNLLSMASSKKTPDCLLIAASENNRIERINFENIINHEVKLYHILTKE